MLHTKNYFQLILLYNIVGDGVLMPVLVLIVFARFFCNKSSPSTELCAMYLQSIYIKKIFKYVYTNCYMINICIEVCILNWQICIYVCATHWNLTKPICFTYDKLSFVLMTNRWLSLFINCQRLSFVYDYEFLAIINNFSLFAAFCGVWFVCLNFSIR